MLLQYGRRGRVYELHGDLLFAGAESVIREITEKAGDVDYVVLDVRGVDDTADVSNRMLLGLRDELRRIGVEAVMVDPAHSVLPLDSDASKRIRHFPDCNAAIEYVEDALIARYGDADAHWGPIQPQDHPLIAGLPDDLLTMLRSRLVPCSYRGR